MSARSLYVNSLVTVQRPDIAESTQDYGNVKAGFQLRLSSLDGRPVRPEEIALVASGTLRGDVRLRGLGCPSPVGSR